VRPGATWKAISSRCMLIASLLHLGMTMPAALPSAGQIAPNSHAEERRWSFGAERRVPRLAQRRVSLIYWPMAAMSAMCGPRAVATAQP
jgi:hypothetical protein